MNELEGVLNGAIFLHLKKSKNTATSILRGGAGKVYTFGDQRSTLFLGKVYSFGTQKSTPLFEQVKNN